MNSANQPEPSVREQESLWDVIHAHMSLLWTNDELGQDEFEHRFGKVMEAIQADKEAAVREARLDQMEYVDQRLIGRNPGGERVFYDKEACIAESKLKDHQRIISEAMKAELRLTHPQAGEGEGK